MIGATKQKIIQLHDWSNLKQKILNSISTAYRRRIMKRSVGKTLKNNEIPSLIWMLNYEILIICKNFQFYNPNFG